MPGDRDDLIGRARLRGRWVWFAYDAGWLCVSDESPYDSQEAARQVLNDALGFVPGSVVGGVMYVHEDGRSATVHYATRRLDGSLSLGPGDLVRVGQLDSCVWPLLVFVILLAASAVVACAVARAVASLFLP